MLEILKDVDWGSLCFVTFVVGWSYFVIENFGYNSIDGEGEPKITIEDEDNEI